MSKAAIAIDRSMRIAMDFAAAGSVLNWAAQQHNNGQVAVFFNLARINEYARVQLRWD